MPNDRPLAYSARTLCIEPHMLLLRLRPMLTCCTARVARPLLSLEASAASSLPTKVSIRCGLRC